MQTIDTAAAPVIDPEKIDVIRPELLQELIKVLNQRKRAEEDYRSFNGYYEYLSVLIRQEYNMEDEDTIDVKTGIINRGGAVQSAPVEEVKES